MIRQEAEFLFGWISNTYPRNYRDATDRMIATAIDNLALVFKGETYQNVISEYQRAYTKSNKEPHPSDILQALSARRVETAKAAKQKDPYKELQKHPKWPEMCHAYGDRECRRAAKLCVDTGTIAELCKRLEWDQ